MVRCPCGGTLQIAFECYRDIDSETGTLAGRIRTPDPYASMRVIECKSCFRVFTRTEVDAMVEVPKIGDQALWQADKHTEPVTVTVRGHIAAHQHPEDACPWLRTVGQRLKARVTMHSLPYPRILVSLPEANREEFRALRPGRLTRKTAFTEG